MALFQGKLEEKESTLVFSRLSVFATLHEDMRILLRKTSIKGDNLSMTYLTLLTVRYVCTHSIKSTN